MGAGTAVAIIILAAIVAFFLYWRFVFLRDPVRSIPAEPRSIVAPADGTVVDVIKWNRSSAEVPKRFIGQIRVLCADVASSCWLVLIFMSPLDVHVNRIPFDGKVLQIKYSKGAFFAAYSLKALQNEKNEVLLKTSFGRIKVVQVAGCVARRIECWLRPNQKVIKGQRFGRINLGSQVVLVLPSKLKVRVRPGQKVKAGSTIVASR